MQVVVILMIIGLFGIWIHNLRQELRDIRRTLPRTPATPDRVLHAAAAPAPVQAPSREGVQIWVLE